MPVPVTSQTQVLVSTNVSNMGPENFTGPTDGAMISVETSGLYRVSLWITVPALATGQSVAMQAYTLDASQVESNFISTKFCSPGEYDSVIGILNGIAGQTLAFKLLANGTQTFVSTCTVAFFLEKL
jgi:hypothetical protein